MGLFDDMNENHEKEMEASRKAEAAANAKASEYANLTAQLKVSIKDKGGFIPPYFCEIIFPESNRALTNFGKTLQSLERCYDKGN